MNLKESLAKLGNTTEAVAKTLTAKGIKGEAHSVGSCPIAQYLTSEGHRFVSVGATSAVSMEEEEFLPLSVMSFVRAFDHGEYPDLVEP